MSKKHNQKGVTRQGVRDLSHIKGKSAGRKVSLSSYPLETMFLHPGARENDNIFFCSGCNRWTVACICNMFYFLG